MPDAVCDSSPFIHLAKIESLELFSRLYRRIFVPLAVWREVVEESDGRPGATEMQRAVAAGWMVKQAVENKALVVALRQTLDGGEAEAIALATELQPEILLLDDKLGRRMAVRLGVPVTGTLGVLLRAKMVGLIPDLRALITRLQSKGNYYIDPLLSTSRKYTKERSTSSIFAAMTIG
jgi:predicted nucleic acid-binding protein